LARHLIRIDSRRCGRSNSLSLKGSFNRATLPAMDVDVSLNSRNHARLVTGVTIAGFCVFLQLYAPQPLLVLFRRVFDASEAQVSLIVSAATLAVALTSPFVGMLADAVGRKRIIVPCLFALSLSTLACGLSQNLSTIIFWRFISGICTPGVIAVTLAYISEESPSRSAGSVTALYVTGTVLGGLTGRLGAAFTADHLSWRWSFALLAILTFIGAIAAWRLLPRSTRFKPQTDWRTGLVALASHLRNGPLMATCFTGFIVLFSHVGLFTYINFYLARPPFSLSTSALGAMFLVYALGIVVTPLSGKVIDRTGHRAGAAASVALVIAGCLLMFVPALLAIIVGVAIASTGVFVGQAAASSHIGRAAKGARSAASGLYVSCYYLGGSAGATALVVPWRRGDWPAIVACIIAAQLVSLMVSWRFFARSPQHTLPFPIE